jgi:thiol-disulfide isomerase/thioredoxin
MNIKHISLLFIWLLISKVAIGQQVEVVKFDAIKDLLKNDSKNVKVINFWATWCGPCVKELPNFEIANKREGVEVVFVSLDFEDQLKKVEKFVKKKGLKSKVILLDEIDYNSWIDQVNTTWSGAIPATMIIAPKGTHQKFIEGELSSEQLDKALQKFL